MDDIFGLVYAEMIEAGFGMASLVLEKFVKKRSGNKLIGFNQKIWGSGPWVPLFFAFTCGCTGFDVLEFQWMEGG